MSPVDEVYPWQEKTNHRLVARARAQRLAHALLFSGRAGLGKRHFTRTVAKTLLCRQSADKPCGQCPSCQMFEAGTHGDFFWLKPEETGKAIRIDAVRELCRHLQLTSREGGLKIAVIEPAEAMNRSAANALLKTLEEPAANTLMILISELPGRLPATIRSRCQKTGFSLPNSETALAWLTAQGLAAEQARVSLAQAGGAPLLALAMAGDDSLEQRRQLWPQVVALLRGRGDALALAAQWHKQAPRDLLAWLGGWLMDLIRLKFCDRPPIISDPQAEQDLHALARTVDLTLLFNALDSVQSAIRKLDSQVNVQLLLEDVLLGLGGRHTGMGDLRR